MRIDRSVFRSHRRRFAAQPLPEHLGWLLNEAQDRWVEFADTLISIDVSEILYLSTRPLIEFPTNPSGNSNHITVGSSILPTAMKEGMRSSWVVCDEDSLPFKPRSFDAIISLDGLHWTNDLPKALRDIRSCLRPRGGTLIGMPSWGCWREVFDITARADIEANGGLSARFLPLPTTQQLVDLFKSAGFTTVVADSDSSSFRFASPLHALRAIRQSGDANALFQRSKNQKFNRPFAKKLGFEKRSNDGQPYNANSPDHRFRPLSTSYCVTWIGAIV